MTWSTATPTRMERRIALAHKYVPRFGVATECGFARARKPDLVRELLALHAAVAPEHGSQRCRRALHA